MTWLAFTLGLVIGGLGTLMWIFIFSWYEDDSVMWQYGELTEETARLVKEHSHEVQSLYALPGAQPEPNLSDPAIQKQLATQWGYVQKPHPDCDSGCMFQCAQPAPSVPEDVMRDAERYRYLRARDDGTAGVGCWIEADGRVCDKGWLYGVQLDSAIDSFIELLAAAPKPEGE